MSIRILIVDDHAVFRSGLHALLQEQEGVQVVGEACNGAEAIGWLRRGGIDVMSLDISMPGISSVDVVQEAMAAENPVAVVMLTMHEDPSYLKQFLQAGAKGFVLKKSTAQVLTAAIRAVHEGGSYVDPAMAAHAFDALVGNTHRQDEASASRLTVREEEVCRLLAFGHTSSQIADLLQISRRTVDTHRSSIMHKLGFNCRAELVRYAIDQGLLRD